jgi:hypothetical protein
MSELTPEAALVGLFDSDACPDDLLDDPVRAAKLVL